MNEKATWFDATKSLCLFINLNIKSETLELSSLNSMSSTLKCNISVPVMSLDYLIADVSEVGISCIIGGLFLFNWKWLPAGRHMRVQNSELDLTST